MTSNNSEILLFPDLVYPFTDFTPYNKNCAEYKSSKLSFTSLPFVKDKK